MLPGAPSGLAPISGVSEAVTKYGDAVRTAAASGKTLVVRPEEVPYIKLVMRAVGAPKLKVRVDRGVSGPPHALAFRAAGQEFRKSLPGDDAYMPPATVSVDLPPYAGRPDGAPLAEWETDADTMHATLYGELRTMFNEPLSVRHGGLGALGAGPTEMQFVTPADLIRFTEEAGVRSYYGESTAVRPSGRGLAGLGGAGGYMLAVNSIAAIKDASGGFKHLENLTFDSFAAAMQKRGYKVEETLGLMKTIVPLMPEKYRKLITRRESGPSIPPPPAASTQTVSERHKTWWERLFSK